MTKLSYRNIEITGGFWAQLQARNKDVTLPAILQRYIETGRMASLDFSTPWEDGKQPHIFWDSDIAKWLEAAAYVLQKGPAPALEQAIEAAIDLIAKHQGDDGYYNIHYTVAEPDGRWQKRSDHELYCAGHLIEAAVAYYQATGRDKFLRCMCKYADYIERVFVHEQSAAFQTCGHEEIELALMRLYHCTGEARYKALSEFFVNTRGNSSQDHPPYDFTNQAYCQSHLPAREQTEAVGHAVRATYLYCAMADLAHEDNALLDACRALFENITQRRMYVTGGIGSTHHGEAFTPDYDLPGETAYAETCAAIGLALFARRMSQVEPDGRYADAAELAIYNGTLAGVSDDGAAFFYECPLEIHPQLRHKHTSTHSHDRYPPTQRQHKFECMCCPANLARFVASFANMLFTQDDYTVYVHHYAHAAHEHITIATQYPRDGEISLHLQGISGKRVALRIPGWCEHFTCSAPGTLDRGYYYVDIPNDDFALQLSLAMPVRLVHANPQVYDLIGRVAVMRGPIVYCLESIDNGDNLRALSIAPNASFSGDFDALQCDGLRLQPGNALYSTTAPPQTAQRLHFIPYFRFANRGEREMAVFVRI